MDICSTDSLVFAICVYFIWEFLTNLFYHQRYLIGVHYVSQTPTQVILSVLVGYVCLILYDTLRNQKRKVAGQL